MSEILIDYLRFTIALSPCNPRKWDILSAYDSVGDFLGNYKSCKIITDAEKSAISQADSRQAEHLLEYCQAKGINVYCLEDRGFPQKLRQIQNPPSVLFTLGRLENVNFSRAVAVVGARRAEEYSLRCAGKISADLALEGVTVISGFAVGIDSSAHSGAISAGGQTVAVLGCGVDYDYPRGSEEFKRVISSNGAVISEFFPSESPHPESFKIRNRISSALSDCVLCIQASSKSGALNTAYHATEQGKSVFVIPPHDIFSPDYQGIISLLRDGAEEIYSAGDIINSLWNSSTHYEKYL